MAAEPVPETLAAVLRAFDEHAPGEPLSTSEVAEGLECTRRTTYNRLERLAEEDLVRTKKVGAKARVWWRSSGSAGDVGEGVQAWDEPTYRRFGDTVGIPLGVFTQDGIVYANEAAAEFVASDGPASVVGSCPMDFVDETDAEAVLDRIDRVLDDRRTPDPAAVRFRTVDGAARSATLRMAPVTYEGHPAAQFVLEGVTEHKRAREEIGERREFFERAVDFLPDVFYVVDEDGRVVLWNDALTERTGYTDEEIAGMRSFEFVPEEQWRATFEEVRNLDDLEESTLEADLLTGEGERIPHEFRHVRLHDDGTGESYWVGIGRDVTERRK
jgi:PAS domain S-box-containing protein